MFPRRIEVGTLRVLSACDNHYTTETNCKKITKQTQNSGEVNRCNKKLKQIHGDAGPRQI